MTKDAEIEALETEIAGLLAEKDAATDPERRRVLRSRILDLRARLDPLIAAREAARPRKPGDSTIGLAGLRSGFASNLGRG